MPAPSQLDPAVTSFLDSLDHPRQSEIQLLRRLILAASPTIHEGIKWNAPSFRTSDYFATIHLRGKDSAHSVRLILHTGAKVKENAKTGMAIADPSNLLEWLAKDRAVIRFADSADIEAKRDALTALLLEWIRWV